MAETIYFPHAVDARNDARVKALYKRYGKAGYADYFQLLEEIYQTNKPILNLSSDLMLESVAESHHMDVAEFEGFVMTCVEVGLFDRELWDARKVTSHGIVEQMDYIAKKVAAGKKGADARWGKSQDNGTNGTC